ncbi:MAG: aminoacyl-tRNA hydrolase [Burkholderiaceae bacterium]|nr:aminoacyl-tRNA hydrolase [Burkholderiaceae bacterium]
MIKLFVGLGNPGAQYEGTRHNAGFWWMERVARQLGVALVPERAHQALMARHNAAGHPIWLLQPQTFMNLSGHSVASLARFFKIAPEEILVAHDELDLPAGQARLKKGGGHAGHNGLRDIHAQLGSSDYWRLRLGIGHPGDKSEVVGWVLRKPPAQELALIEQAADRAAAAFALLAAGEMERAMTQIHTTAAARAKPPRPTAANAANAAPQQRRATQG